MVSDRWDPGIHSQSGIRWGLQGYQQTEGLDTIWNQRGDLENGSLPDPGDFVEEEKEDYKLLLERLGFDLFGYLEVVLFKTKSKPCKGGGCLWSCVNFQIRFFGIFSTVRSVKSIWGNLEIMRKSLYLGERVNLLVMRKSGAAGSFGISDFLAFQFQFIYYVFFLGISLGAI
ncbi:hypothetical protein HA466_0285520 [Hirschfeldia incana]|nr:hypothetical protein HA466_0285520 [Hirschfeldia incana]